MTGPGVETDTLHDEAHEVALLGGNELVADSFGEYLSVQWKKIRNGESGALPVVIGLIIIVIIFQSKDSKFLSSGNLVNLIQQSGVFILLGMAEVFVLLLGEIDLSAGWVGAVGATITGELATDPHNLNWALAVIAGLAACAVIGLIYGLLVTQLGLPSFIVTLGGLLFCQGFQLWLIQKDSHAVGGSLPLTSNTLNDLVYGSMSVTASWIVTIAVFVLYAAFTLTQWQRRRRSGLVTPPTGLILVKLGLVAVAGIVVMLICSKNRGFGTATLNGVPWIVPILLLLLVLFSILLSRMRFGRYIYAIGGNAEAARRAGISLTRVRILGFMLCTITSGAAGMVYLSQQGGISSNVDGGTLVLYAVAAAVIGGVSLFGGRGKIGHALLGGLIVTAIFNGMGLISIGAAGQNMVVAIVLVAAVTVDAVARRGRTTR